MKFIRIIVLVYAFLAFIISSSAQTLVSADYGTWTEFPLVKKIGIYQTPLTCSEWVERDFPKLSQIPSRVMRYEMGWGRNKQYGTDAIDGTLEQPTYDFSAVDFMLDIAKNNTQSFILSHCYIPKMLQQSSNGLLDPPVDYNIWKDINKVATEHWKQKGYSNRYVEIWNEPDFSLFFNGTLDDYLKIYQYASLGAREADPDAKIGGPALAFQTRWYQSLVNHVKNSALPLDFLSGHAYGTSFTWTLEPMRKALNSLGNNCAEMLLTEYTPYEQADYAANGKVERAEAAAAFFNALSIMLKYTDLEYVTWAQYIDPQNSRTGQTFTNGDKLGIMDGNDGSRKALFNAFRLYGMMPINRCEMTTGGLGGMSSADDKHVATVLWNNSDTEKKIWLTLKNIPFSEGTIEIYQIDTLHNSWYETGKDDLVPTLVSTETFTNNQYKIRNSILPQGVFFISATSLDADPLFPENNFAKLIKTQHWYTQRSEEAPYALFDTKTWSAFLSMNSNDTGLALESIIAEDLPSRISVKCIDNGLLSFQDNNSTLNLRMDYQAENGKYTKSVLFYDKFYNQNRNNIIPWGTQKVPDEIVKITDIHDFTIDVNKYKPKDSNGRIIITFEMCNMGKGAKANFQLLKNDESSINNLELKKTENNTMYSPTGIRINKKYKGLVIQNGKKKIIH